MARFEVLLRCTCGHKYKRILKSLDQPDPPCPKCKKAAAPPRGIDLTSGKAPAAVGMSVNVKAMDETANIVMQDYGMTDMRDNVREGETARPKLRPDMQKKVEGFFGGGGKKRSSLPPNIQRAIRSANSGALRPENFSRTPNPIGAIHETRSRAPTRVIAQHKERPS